MEGEIPDPAKPRLFKTMYTLEGEMLETLEELKSYCEDPLYRTQVKKVTINDDSPSLPDLNDRDIDHH